ncbi:hypothetical protein DPMN_029617 [Dreissena polymorpha]|uniref:Ig-like domain-containing protein n=1 Tax=Dreissena polymorpha TaxID=45954 RepID=A0A9D4LWS3_DREPO|nr:hypothetical protein DPMN_029617 [Dreissena polymorpha]
MDQQSVSVTDKRNVTFVCKAFGDPSPHIKLTSESVNVSTNNSYLRLNKYLTSRQDSGTFTCIATNGLGAENRSIYVQANGQDDARSYSFTLALCLGCGVSGVLVLVAVLWVYKRRDIVLQIFHSNDRAIEINAEDARDQTSRSRDNNGNMPEGDGSQIATHHGCIRKLPSGKTRGFYNQSYEEYSPRNGNADNDLEENRDNEPFIYAADAVQKRRGVWNETYADWFNPSTPRPDNTKSTDQISCEHVEESPERRIHTDGYSHTDVNKHRSKQTTDETLIATRSTNLPTTRGFFTLNDSPCTEKKKGNDVKKGNVECIYSIA